MRRPFWVLSALFLLTVAGTALAHHSFPAVYDAKVRKSITGVVTEMLYQNPHARLYLRVKNADGTDDVGGGHPGLAGIGVVFFFFAELGIFFRPFEIARRELHGLLLNNRHSLQRKFNTEIAASPSGPHVTGSPSSTTRSFFRRFLYQRACLASRSWGVSSWRSSDLSIRFSCC